MRNWLSSVLIFIGTSALTDEEFDSIDTDLLTLNVYNQASYDALSGVLTSREAVSTLQDKLVSLFSIKGFEVSPTDTAKSEIYLGSVL